MAANMQNAEVDVSDITYPETAVDHCGIIQFYKNCPICRQEYLTGTETVVYQCEDEECSICMETLDVFAHLPCCKHYHCTNCAKDIRDVAYSDYQRRLELSRQQIAIADAIRDQLVAEHGNDEEAANEASLARRRAFSHQQLLEDLPTRPLGYVETFIQDNYSGIFGEYGDEDPEEAPDYYDNLIVGMTVIRLRSPLETDFVILGDRTTRDLYVFRWENTEVLWVENVLQEDNSIWSLIRLDNRTFFFGDDELMPPPPYGNTTNYPWRNESSWGIRWCVNGMLPIPPPPLLGQPPLPEAPPPP